MPEGISSALIAILFLGTATSSAGETVEKPTGVIQLQGRPATRVAFEKGRLVVWQDEQRIWSKRLKGVDPKATPVAAPVEHQLVDGETAVQFTVRATTGAQVAAVVVLSRGKPRLVWQGKIDLAGDPGERTGNAVRFADLDGDGLVEIAVGQVSEAVQLCGVTELPLLFRRVYDPQAGKLRPVLAKRPGLAEPLDVEGVLDPGDRSGPPLVQSISPRAVSRFAGDQGSVLALGPPTVLGDQDQTSAWIPVPGNGAGEFASFAVLANAYRIDRIGVLPLVGKETDYPETLLVTTDDRVYRLIFPKGTDPDPGQTVWFDLPEPKGTTCLSLLIEKSRQAKGRLAIAEVIVLTEIDRRGGMTRLAGDLSDPDRRRQAAMLLERAGAAGTAAIAKAWPKLDKLGRRRAVAVLASRPGGQGIELLAEAVVGRDPVASRTAQTGLARVGEAAVEHLSGYLKSKDDFRFGGAVSALAALESQAGLRALCQVAGQGERKQRVLLRRKIGAAARNSSDKAACLWRELERAAKGKDSEKWADLVRAAIGVEQIADQVVELAVGLYQNATEFSDRYRLLFALGQTKSPQALGPLLNGASDRDSLIRQISVAGLSLHLDGAGALQQIAQALADTEPGVRLAALGALHRAEGDQIPGQELLELLNRDPWPKVRAGVAELAGVMPGRVGARVISSACQDSSALVRLAASRNAVQVQGQEVDRSIVALLTNRDELLEVRRIAAQTAGARCQSSAIPGLFVLLKQGAEPLAPPDAITAAVAAAQSLGALGGKEAERLLKKARKRSNAATDRAIDAALATLGHKCQPRPPQAP